MEDFFKKLGGDKKRTNKHKTGGGIKNPFANLNVGGGTKKFSGQGQSLGGSKPGKVIKVSLQNHGSLGIKVEKTQRGGAIIAGVAPSSQASHAGLERGDIICIANSNGEEEMHFEQFMAIAASDRRPFVFDVRRIHVKNSKMDYSESSKNKNVRTLNLNSSADAHARRQAVIAAAEARDREHKKKTKHVSKVTSTIDSSKFLSSSERRKLEAEQKSRLEELEKQGPQSEESRTAVMEAKRGEALSTQQLGFNMYETKKLTGGQAKTATVDFKHGSVDANGADSSHLITSNIVNRNSSRIPKEAASASAKANEASDTIETVNDSFDEAFSILVSSNENIGKSLSTMHTLINNATTKGQMEGESNSKYRRVRLSNKKINDLIVSVHGAIDIMMLFGFVFHEEDNETFLIYPLDTTPPKWLDSGLKRMKQYQLRVDS